MHKSYTDPLSKSSAKEARRKILRYLVDDEGFTFAELRQVWRTKKYFPIFRLPQRRGVIIDFRGCK